MRFKSSFNISVLTKYHYYEEVNCKQCTYFNSLSYVKATWATFRRKLPIVNAASMTTVKA